MSLFMYHATDAAGKFVKGSLEASDKKALVDKLQGMGLFPIRVGNCDPAKSHALPKGRRSIFSRRVPARCIVDFTQELSDMLAAGIALDRAILILAELEKNDIFKKVLEEIHNGIHAGATFADCLDKHPELFSDVYINTVRAGEAGGSLELVLSRLKKFIDDAKRLKEDISSALIYPLLLTIVGGGAVALMLLVFIPKFSVILDDMGGVMPLSTQVLLDISGALIKYWPLIIGFIIAAVIGMRFVLRSESGRRRWDALKLIIPMFGPILRKSAVSRFARTLGALMQGGLPILEALDIAIKTMGNASMAGDMGPVVEGVRRGKGFSAPLGESASFPPLAVHMLAVGEETGRLDETLLRLSDKYDRDVGIAVKRLLSLLEPLIILVMAVIVGFVVISLLLAVFSLNDMPM